MNQVYDVIIIGCGEAGIYAGYELSLKNPSLKIGVFEQGRDIYKRSCPIVAKKVKQCINCKVCDTMCGFGGAGAFSDGKFNFTTEFGGWLTDYMDHDEVMELIHYVYDILQSGTATEKQIPLVGSQEDSYLYESMTGQWLTDFEFWKQNDKEKTFLKNIDQKTDYVCVYTDSQLYLDHKEYFDSLQRIYQNPAGFIAANAPAEETY